MSADLRLACWRRRSIRLWEYDYRREGAYFVTICTYNRTMLFGSVRNAHVLLTDAGRAVRTCWSAIPQYFPHIALDRFVIMPDHLHAIIVIGGREPNADDGNAHESNADGRSGIVGARHAVPLHDRGTTQNVDGRHESNRDVRPDVVGARHAVPLHDPGTIAVRIPTVRPAFGRPVRGSLATIIGAFKSAATRRLRATGHRGKVWQRNYFEHIIRNDDDLWAIRRYIVTNPGRWNDG